MNIKPQKVYMFCVSQFHLIIRYNQRYSLQPSKIKVWFKLKKFWQQYIHIVRYNALLKVTTMGLRNIIIIHLRFFKAYFCCASLLFCQIEIT